MLKIKVEQPLREYVSLDSLPIGAVFIRRVDDEFFGDDRFFMKTDTNAGSFSHGHGSAVCDAICLNDGTFCIIRNDTEVHEVKAELTISRD